ncbi:hypothetical protein V8C86DRAFT_3101917 [Haematococcus lacustris]
MQLAGRPACQPRHAGVNGTSADPGALTQPEMRSEVLSMEMVHDPAPEQPAALQPAHKDFVPELLKGTSEPGAPSSIVEVAESGFASGAGL